MSNFAFKKSCAMAVAIIYLLVFICSPCEATTNSNSVVDGHKHDSKSKDNSINSVQGGYPGTGGSLSPAGGDWTELIILGAIAVVVVVALIVSSGKEEKTVKAENLDSVLTTPSSLKFTNPNASIPDSFSTFTVTLVSDSARTILDGKVSLVWKQSGWRSVLSFTNIIGAARDLDGPFDGTFMAVRTGDVFYVKVSSSVLYRVKVVEEGRDGVTLTFEKR